jgi:hypothetical protein
MYNILLPLHSLFRWLVVASLLYAIYRAYKGLFTNKLFSPFDNAVRHNTATIAHIQLVIGVWLYLISPIIHYFLHNYKEAVHQREIRFFGMEHNIMMLAAIIIISIGSGSARRKTTDRDKFKTMAIWFSIAFIIILVAVPWKFSPFAARPYFRSF